VGNQGVSIQARILIIPDNEAEKCNMLGPIETCYLDSGHKPQSWIWSRDVRPPNYTCDELQTYHTGANRSLVGWPCLNASQQLKIGVACFALRGSGSGPSAPAMLPSSSQKPSITKQQHQAPKTNQCREKDIEGRIIPGHSSCTWCTPCTWST